MALSYPPDVMPPLPGFTRSNYVIRYTGNVPLMQGVVVGFLGPHMYAADPPVFLEADGVGGVWFSGSVTGPVQFEDRILDNPSAARRVLLLHCSTHGDVVVAKLVGSESVTEVVGLAA